MTGTGLRDVLLLALPRLAASEEELRDLDAAIGDGDLGITVSAGCAAAVACIQALPESATPASVLRTIAPAVARANPSTFSALVSAALLAASRALETSSAPGTLELIDAGRIAAQTIAARGKSALGDKTVLDALVPSLDAAEQHPDAPLSAAINAARLGVESTRGLASSRGRAAWIGERTRGHADPGATAYLRLLEAIAASQAATRTAEEPAAGRRPRMLSIHAPREQ